MRGATRSARINGTPRSNRAAALLAFRTRATFATAAAAAFAAIAAATTATTPTPVSAIATAALIAAALIVAFGPRFTGEIARPPVFTAIPATTAALAATATMAPLAVVTVAGLFRTGSGRAAGFRGRLVAAKKTFQPTHETTWFFLLDDRSTLRLPRRAGFKLAFVAGIARLTRFPRST